MKRLLLTLALIALLPMAAQSAADSLNKESRQVYKNPTGNRFPVLAWYSIRPESELTPERYRQMAEAGFNISFSHFTTRQEVRKALEACRGTGVMQMVTATDLSQQTADFVNEFKDDPMVAGWFLVDEPTTHSFVQLRDFRNRILRTDKSHVLYLNLLPIYVNPHDLGTKNYREYVARFADEVDLGLISYDNYPVLADAEGREVLRDNFYDNLEQVLSVSRESRQPFWAFALATAHDPYPVATREALRLQVFSNLAYGAQCIQYFTYWNPRGTIWNFNTAPISIDGEPTHVYYLVRDVNREIHALTDVFLGCEVVDVAHIAPQLPAGTHAIATLPEEFSSVDGGSDGHFLVSHLRNRGYDYLMILNTDIREAHNVSIGKNHRPRRIMADGSAVKDRGSRVEHTLKPGDYLLYRWPSPQK